MKRILFIVLFFFAFSCISFSQDWKDELIKELVIFEEGKMTSTDYTLITMNDGRTMQIKAYAEVADKEIISRDQFIAIFSITTFTLIQEMLDEARLKDDEYKMKTIDELIGSADIEINCYMGKNGIQIELKAGSEIERFTQTWEDLYE